jgi:dephospho-CoA kinase
VIRVGVCGGIGSGKSEACRIFEGFGVPIYVADVRAKELMQQEPLLSELQREFGDCFDGAALNRKRLAERVFGNPTELQRLNAMVHPAVRADFRAWCDAQQADYVVFESAILFDSNFDSEVDITVGILSPMPLRVERVVKRDGCSEEHARQRIAVQMTDDEIVARATVTIVNIAMEDFARDIEELNGRIRQLAALQSKQS